MTDLQAQAFAECSSPVTTAHHGITAGGTFWSPQYPNNPWNKNGRPFWNRFATQFMYTPCFEFAPIPGCTRYLFTATDCNGAAHTFEADTPMALLAPIWGELPEGYVELKVEALEEDGTPISLVGARTFFRVAPFAGPEAYPPKACSYRECAVKAFRYSYQMPSVQYWLEHGVPDPTYDLNVYPSKMVSSIIQTMIAYAAMDPENADNAIQLAKNAADYVLSISVGSGSPLEGLPPTYYTRFREVTEDTDNAAAAELEHTIMMLYPARMGEEYLSLAQVTGEARYLEAAMKIAHYYRENVLESGSWHLVVSIETGESLSPNECTPDDIIAFLHKVYAHTGESVWKELIDNAHAYRLRNRLEPFNWEGQFEDTPASSNYSNLTHFAADSMICYIADHQADDPQAIAQAEELMRFVEDQFVVWHKYAPRNRWLDRTWLSKDTGDWTTPAAMEQYNWYVPIDSSTSTVMYTFLRLYKATGNPLLLAKACALADSITRIQNPESGMIPTHWTRTTCREDGGDLWINCHNATAICMMAMAEAIE